jgi:hypothetical protein
MSGLPPTLVNDGNKAMATSSESYLAKLRGIIAKLGAMPMDQQATIVSAMVAELTTAGTERYVSLRIIHYVATLALVAEVEGAKIRALEKRAMFDLKQVLVCAARLGYL